MGRSKPGKVISKSVSFLVFACLPSLACTQPVGAYATTRSMDSPQPLAVQTQTMIGVDHDRDGQPSGVLRKCSAYTTTTASAAPTANSPTERSELMTAPPLEGTPSQDWTHGCMYAIDVENPDGSPAQQVCDDGCAINNFEKYIPFDSAGQITNTRDAHHCQNECMQNTRCAFWTRESDGHCHLMNSNATRSPASGYESGKKCSNPRFTDCTRYCYERLRIDFQYDAGSNVTSVQVVPTPDTRITPPGDCHCSQSSINSRYMFRFSTETGLYDLVGTFSMPLPGFSDPNMSWAFELSRHTAKFKMQLLPYTGTYGCFLGYTWVEGCGGNCRPVNCSLDFVDIGAECNPQNSNQTVRGSGACEAGERADHNCIQIMPRCGGGACPEVPLEKCVDFGCDSQGGGNRSEVPCPFSVEFAKRHNVRFPCNDSSTEPNPCNSVRLEDDYMDPACCDIVATYCAVSANAQIPDEGCNSDIIHTVGGLCGWPDEAEAASGVLGGLENCNCGSCEAIDYGICDCLDAVFRSQKIRPNVADCSELTDIDGDAVCGFDQVNGRCTGCNQFRSRLSCVDAGSSCTWNSSTTTCGAASADPDRVPQQDALGIQCTAPLADEDNCQCMQRSFMSDEFMMQNARAMAPLFRAPFQVTSCGTVGRASCPGGVGYIKMECNTFGSWDPSTWDASGCVNSAISTISKLTPTTFSGLQRQLSILSNNVCCVPNILTSRDGDIQNIRKWMTAATRLLQSFVPSLSDPGAVVPFIRLLICMVTDVLTQLSRVSTSSDFSSAGFRTEGDVVLASKVSLDFDQIKRKLYSILRTEAPWLQWYVNAYQAPSGVCVSNNTTARRRQTRQAAYSNTMDVNAMSSRGPDLVPQGTIGYYIRVEGKSDSIDNSTDLSLLGSIVERQLPLLFDQDAQVDITRSQFTDTVFPTGPISQSFENTISLLASLLPPGESLLLRTSRMRAHATSLRCDRQPPDDERLVLSVSDEEFDGIFDGNAESDNNQLEALFTCPNAPEPLQVAIGVLGYNRYQTIEDNETTNVDESSVDNTYNSKSWSETVDVPVRALTQSGCTGRSTFGLVLTTYGVDSLFTEEENSDGDSITEWIDPLTGERFNRSIQSRISSLSFGDGNTNATDVNRYIDGEIILQFAVENGTSVPVCGYFDYADELWRSDGGSVEKISNDDVVFCKFNHTTNFAVLTGIDGHDGSPGGNGDDDSVFEHHSNALSIIMYIGVAVTLVCCILTVGTYCIYSELRTTAKWILMNIFVTLVIGEALFVTGVTLAMEADSLSTTSCYGIGIATHYFLLAAFGWMLMDGLFIHFIFTNVYAAHRRDETSLFRKYAAAAYGGPLIAVGVTVGLLGSDYYGSDGRHCFLVADDGAIWAFTGPMVGVLALNAVMLVRIVRVVYSASVRRKSSMADGDHRKYETRVKTKRALHASISFFWLMGLGWGFGLFAIGDLTLTFQYIFSIMLGLQGLCLFLFHCALDESVRKKWKESIGFRSKQRKSASGVVRRAEMRSGKPHGIGGTDSTISGSIAINAGVPDFRAVDNALYNNNRNKKNSGGTDDGYIGLHETRRRDSDVSGQKLRQPTDFGPSTERDYPTDFGSENSSVGISMRSLPSGSVSSVSQGSENHSVPDTLSAGVNRVRLDAAGDEK